MRPYRCQPKKCVIRPESSRRPGHPAPDSFTVIIGYACDSTLLHGLRFIT
jgi:hypothetical protein